VLAFDPENDDPDLLRTVVMLLRTVAITTSARKGSHQVATAEEKIREALTQLVKIDSVKKLSAAIQKSASRIDGEYQPELEYPPTARRCAGRSRCR
jgi:hypothetical protein